MPTCDQAKIIKLVDQNARKAQSAADECRSVSTVQSGDEQLMRNKIDLNQNSQREIIGVPEPMQEQLFDNGVPGVGTYNIQPKNGRPKNCAWEKSKKELVFPKEHPVNHIMQHQMQSSDIKAEMIKNNHNTESLLKAYSNSNALGAGQHPLVITAQNKS